MQGYPSGQLKINTAFDYVRLNLRRKCRKKWATRRKEARSPILIKCQMDEVKQYTPNIQVPLIRRLLYYSTNSARIQLNSRPKLAASQHIMHLVEKNIPEQTQPSRECVYGNQIRRSLILYAPKKKKTIWTIN